MHTFILLLTSNLVSQAGKEDVVLLKGRWHAQQLAFSEDGKMLYWGSIDRKIHVWNWREKEKSYEIDLRIKEDLGLLGDFFYFRSMKGSFYYGNHYGLYYIKEAKGKPQGIYDPFPYLRGVLTAFSRDASEDEYCFGDIVGNIGYFKKGSKLIKRKVLTSEISFVGKGILGGRSVLMCGDRLGDVGFMGLDGKGISKIEIDVGLEIVCIYLNKKGEIGVITTSHVAYRVTEDKKVHRINPGLKKSVMDEERSKDNICCYSFVNDKKIILLGTYGGYVVSYSTEKEDVISVFHVIDNFKDNYLVSIAVSPDNRWIAIGSWDNEVRVFPASKVLGGK